MDSRESPWSEKKFFQNTCPSGPLGPRQSCGEFGAALSSGALSRNHSCPLCAPWAPDSTAFRASGERGLCGMTICGLWTMKRLCYMVEEWAQNAGLYLYDRRVWVKDPCWENGQWHSLSYLYQSPRNFMMAATVPNPINCNPARPMMACINVPFRSSF